MDLLSRILNTVLSLKPYVLLPVIILILSMTFRLPWKKSLMAALTIGVGFIGIFTVFDLFVASIAPAVKGLVQQTGLRMNAMDVGWPPLAAITWSFKMAPLFLIAGLVVNVIFLTLRWTKTVNIDLWNYWHFIFTGALVYQLTGNIFWALAATSSAAIISLKLADWSAPSVERFSGLSGVSISTFSALTYYPLGVLGERIFEKIPFLNRIEADPEAIRRRLGLLGEPLVIGFLLGAMLGIGARYDLKKTLDLAFSIAAVIYLLPIMSGILGKGLMPISDGIKDVVKHRFPHIGETYIGLDNAILVGNTSVVVTALLLMPFALILAFILPGVQFIPLGDLPNMVGAVVMILVATRGNVVKSIIIALPMIVAKLYIASEMAGVYSRLSQNAGVKYPGYHGLVTSFLDGGNVLRYGLVQCFTGDILAIIVLSGLLIFLVFSWVARKNRKTPSLDG